MVFQNGNSMDRIRHFISVLQRRPIAAAKISGSEEYPSINGTAYFYQTRFGVLTVVQVFGLPTSGEPCGRRVFAFHIHNGSTCTGTSKDPFADALTHYNPDRCPHPYHSGDLPPLFGNNGYAFQAFLTDRFSAREIIGRTIIIHLDPDDFTTQPSGNAGAKIACGQIQRFTHF